MAKTYNPKDILVSVDTVPVTGYADGDDVIQVDYNNPFVETMVGVTGEGAFVEHNDHSGKIVLKLLATSVMNDAFSILVAANAEFVVGLTDARGTTVVAAVSCRFEKLPQVQFGGALGMREWTILALEIIENVGGNTA